MYLSHYNQATPQHILYNNKGNIYFTIRNDSYLHNTRHEPKRQYTLQEHNDTFSWDICWDYLSSNGCKRDKMCRWRHINDNNVESMYNTEREPKLMAEGVVINILNDDNIENESEIQLILYNIIYYQTALIDQLIKYTKLERNKIQNAFTILCLLGFIYFNSDSKEYEICSTYLSTNLYHTKDPLMIELQRKFGDFYFGQFKPFQLYQPQINTDNYSSESVTETATVNSNNYSIENNSNSVVSSNNNSSFDLLYEQEDIKDKYAIADRLIKQQKIKKILSFAKRRQSQKLIQ
eukprot:30423_1